WYFKGFPVGGAFRHQLALVTSLAALDDLIAGLDGSMPWPGDAAEGQRGRAGSSRVVALPEGWLDSRELSRGQRSRVAGGEGLVTDGGGPAGLTDWLTTRTDRVADHAGEIFALSAHVGRPCCRRLLLLSSV